jgi:RHS repeat-associated protein
MINRGITVPSINGMPALRRTIFLILTVCAMAICVSGQNIQFTQGNVGSGLEHTITVPLRTYPGRGGASLSVNLTYTSRVWRISPITTILNNQWAKYQTITEAIYAENTVAGWKSTIDLPVIEWPRNDDTYYYSGKPFCHVCGSNSRQFRVARVYIILPDGSKHEFRKSDQPYEGSIDMFGTFYAVDGTRMRYDSTGQNTGTLYLADGSRYVLNSSTAQYIDRNGNTLNYDNATRQWTDTLGRLINLPLPANPTVGEQSYTLPGMPLPYKLIWKHLSDAGVLTPLPGGGTPTRKPIANDYLPFPNNPPTPPSGNNFPQKVVTSWSEQPSLFISTLVDDEDMGPETIVVGRGQVGGELFDPVVLTEVVLPNNLSYKFTYNIYGEIDKVIYPTGAFERYTFSTIPAIGDVKPPYNQASRGVTLRQLSVNGSGNDLIDWQYAAVKIAGPLLRITTTSPLNGPRTEVYRKEFPTPSHQGTQGSITYYWPFGLEDARQGELYEEQMYAPGVGGAMLRRTLKDYDQTSNIVQPSIPLLDPTTKTAYRNSRLIREVNILLDTGGDALASSTSYEYDPDPNLTLRLTTGLDLIAKENTHFLPVAQSTAQTDTIGAISPGARFSRFEMVYLDDAVYRSRNLLGLPISVLIKNGNLQVVSKVTSFYDESDYVPPPAYSDLGAPDWIDPGTPARGNVTTLRRYFDISANLYLETHSQFDQCGNSIKAWNERNLESFIEYSSAFKHAYATSTTSPVPDPSGGHGSDAALTTFTDYELSTGLVLSSTDANGQTTTYSYRDDGNVLDPLKRVRKVTRPDGGWTKTDYNDVVGDLFALVQTKEDDTRIAKIYQYVDPLGRNSRTFTGELGSNYQATDIIYDGLGRIVKTSNPYLTSQRDGVAAESHTANWTTTQYDTLGRVTLVTLPDAATVQNTYEGIYTTVTDQAGKQRRQQVDAHGRVVRVDEPDAGGNLGSVSAPAQPASYEYNVMGQVIHVAQGSQHRYFRYDALGRLTHEREVEPLVAPFTTNDAQTAVNPTTNTAWTRRLIYDETLFGTSYKGLVTGMYDARQILTQTLYDNLNRIVTITYSDATPSVNNFYDNAGFTVSGDNRPVLNKGRLTEVRTAAVAPLPATSQFSNFDLMGRVIQSRQTVGTNEYTFSYLYNVGGGLTSQTYPSGRVVNYGFDDAGRMAQVNSGTTTYANQFVYNNEGALGAFRLGNGALQSFEYNSRLQLKSIDLTKAGTQIQHYDYKYGVFDPNTGTVDQTKNNGQVAQIESLIGAAKQWQQNFTYDSVSRLTTTREKRGDNNQQSYLVKYDYDVYGNRFQYQAQNGGNPFNQVWVETGEISAANNRFTSGVVYDDAGNITSDSKFRNKQFTYDANNRQSSSANIGGSGTVTSVFDGGGQRVATMANGDLTSISVYDAMGMLVAEYGQSTMNGTQYLVSDHQATPRVVTSAAGSVISRHDYLPYGEELASGIGMRTGGQGYGGQDGITRKYTGMETDNATGMAHTLWRKYDQLSGRWTTTDPYGGSMTVTDPQSFNRYTYVNNDPVNRVDPSGLMVQLPDASTSWSDVADTFWGEDFSQTARETGRSIIQNGMDGFPDRAEDEEQEEEEAEPEARTPIPLGSCFFQDPQQQGQNADASQTNNDPEGVRVDNYLAEIFTDGGIVRGAGSRRNEPGRDTHYQLANGTTHTFHIYADANATNRTGIYVPAAFSDIRWVGKSTVVARNPKTNEVLQFYHVLKSSAKPPNKKGSRYIGEIGGSGGEGKNDVHAHVTLFKNRNSRDIVHAWIHEPIASGGITRNIDTSMSKHVRDIRTLVK